MNSFYLNEGRTDVIVLSRRLRINFRIKKMTWVFLILMQRDCLRLPESGGMACGYFETIICQIHRQFSDFKDAMKKTTSLIFPWAKGKSLKCLMM